MEATFAADENETLLNSSKVGRFSRELYYVVELQLSHVIWAISCSFIVQCSLEDTENKAWSK